MSVLAPTAEVVGRDLVGIVGPERVLTGHLQRVAYASDASFYRLVPQAVVFPATLDEMRRLFAWARQSKVPLTFRAAGTSLSGQAVTDGVLVDVSKHWRHLDILDHGQRVRVEPGLIGGVVNARLRPFGRKLGPDPASINACMLGGILANNSSGMCCGTERNAYRTLESMRLMLADGTLVDTDVQAAESAGAVPATVAAGLLGLRARVLGEPALLDKIRRKYQYKNTTGYSLNALVDFERPADILSHLLIGSEGTLGFIAQAVLRTVPDPPHKLTGLIFFQDLVSAAEAIQPLRQAAAAAIELMDRQSLRTVQTLPAMPSQVADLDDNGAAILCEFAADKVADLEAARRGLAGHLKRLRLVGEPVWAETPAAQAGLWSVRKGLTASVGAARPSGTSMIMEDVLFPPEHLVDGVVALQQLFARYGYDTGSVFGHARDGNLHFIITQSFDSEAEIERYDRFTRDMVEAVVSRGGALKAEHGTGRNMAPFVLDEWGADAVAVMRDIKALLDPAGILNPGVVLSDDPQAHVHHLKTLPSVEPVVDACIECGFCESRCPSRDLSLTPRQRIVVRREMARGGSNGAAAALWRDYQWWGNETCATDGLCATACPVGIDTGGLIKQLRRIERTGRQQEWAERAARHFGWLETAARIGLRLGHLAAGWLGTETLNTAIAAAEKLTHVRLPRWQERMPQVAPTARAVPAGSTGTAAVCEAVYFPSCVARTLATADGRALGDIVAAVAARAGIALRVVDGSGSCCGMPFGSKGFERAGEWLRRRLIARMWEWSQHGRVPIIMDTSSCAWSLRARAKDLPAADRECLQRMTVHDPIEWLHGDVLPRLTLAAPVGRVALHPVCSAVKLGLAAKMEAVARQCAAEVVVPLSAGCCGFAGDRGLLHPELTAAATRAEAAEVRAAGCGGFYSTGRTCEWAMSEATGLQYESLVRLVERASASSVSS
jgi:D-lactate dehydrogenase